MASARLVQIMKRHLDLIPIWLESHRDTPEMKTHAEGFRLHPPPGHSALPWLCRELSRFTTLHLHGVFGWARYAPFLEGNLIASFRGSDLNLGVYRQPADLKRVVDKAIVCTYMNPIQMRLAQRLFRPAGAQMIVPNHKSVEQVEATRLNLSKPIICCVNEFRRVTGLDVLLQAFDKLQRGTLLLVGPFHPVDAPYYEQMLPSVLNVHRTGAVSPSRVLEYLKASDLAVFPSVSEGMPNKVLEAMSAGVPVIGSNVPGISQIIEDGVHGRLFRSRDSEDLLRVLKEALQTPSGQRRDWTAQALRKVRQEYSLKREVEGWLECYRLAGLNLDAQQGQDLKGARQSQT